MKKIVRVLLAAGLAWGLAACRTDGSVRHEGHLAKGKDACAPCHGQGPSAPRPAAVADCVPCHKEAGGASAARISAWEARRAETSKARRHGYGDVRFDHGPHAAAGAACAACHAVASLAPGGVSLPSMEACVECHRKEGAPGDCSACHSRLRKESPPPSHGTGWESEHGAVSFSKRESCALCHDDRSCSTCHASRKPRSHVGGWDRSMHGIRAIESRANCAACHEAAFCDRCHSVPPPSHAIPGFRFSAHARAARFNPRSCTVCHERALCLTCHTGTP